MLPTRTDLIYNIVEQTLAGSIDGVSINAQAGSGGRAGSRHKNAINPFLANNPYATGVKLTPTQVGGPLPRARYTLTTHEKHHLWIRLTPFKEDQWRMGDRNGMAIHRSGGERGSDGCIVPTDFTVVELIHRLCQSREKAGKPAPTLEVVSVGDLEPFERLHRTA